MITFTYKIKINLSGGLTMKKKIFALILSTLMTLSFATACGSSTNSNVSENTEVEETSEEPEQEQIVLRVAEAQMDTYPATMGVIEFARLVEERSEGRIKVEVYTGGQLGGDEKAVLEQVQFGAIDFTRVNISPVTELQPMLNLLQMPYLYRDEEHMHNVLDGSIGEQFLASVEDANLVGLALYDAGSRNFYNSEKPITKLEDMKGLKIRVPQSSLMMGLVEALGATPTPMAFGEVYSALQTGVIDGAENNWVSYDMNSHSEVAKYIVLDGHTAPPEIFVASKMVFDKLSTEDQELIRQAAADSVVWEREEYKGIEDASRQKVIDAGAIVTELEDREAFVEAVQPLYEEFAGDYKDIMEAIINTK
jgi:tripartite ATP-independent transporter DctP family solute receptor